MAAQLCTVCGLEESKYTCPRCSIKTCSLNCSATHKVNTSCTGIRDKGKYVPLNQYGWGRMVDDYTFLEQVGRQIEGWGRDITAKGFGMVTGNRAPKKNQKYKKRSYSKRDILSFQLGLRDINMDVLPSGMDRHRHNKSFWDSKNHTAILTIEFFFHLSDEQKTSFSIISHKNDFRQSLRTLIHKNTREHSKLKENTALLHWLSRFDDNQASHLVCLIQDSGQPEAIDNQHTLTKIKIFKHLDLDSPLSSELRYQEFVEYPGIHVMEEIFSHQFLGNDQASHSKTPYHLCSGLQQGKATPSDTKLSIGNLLEGYGSETEQEDTDVLLGLANYSGSESEGDTSNNLEETEQNVLHEIADTEGNGMLHEDTSL